MTSTFKKLENFKKALKPNLDSVERNAAIILDSSFVSASQKTILREIEMVRWLRPNLKKFFYSMCIDFSRKKNLTNEFLKEVCFEYLDSLALALEISSFSGIGGLAANVCLSAVAGF